MALNTSIIKAILISLLLVADEYRLALQCKHWEETCDSDEATNNLQFLVAVANDCYRISTVHLEAISLISTSNNLSHINCNGDGELNSSVEDLVLKVSSSFNDVIRATKKAIVRMIFSDLLVVVADFDALWDLNHPEAHNAGNHQSSGPLSGVKNFTAQSLRVAKTSVLNIIPGKNVQASKSSLLTIDGINPIETLVVTMNDYFKDLSQILEREVFIKIPAACAEVCTVRYLYFLKCLSERIQSNSIAAEIDMCGIIEADIQKLLDCFTRSVLPPLTIENIQITTEASSNEALISEQSNLPNSMKKKLNYLQNILVVLKAIGVVDPKLLGVLRELAVGYCHSQELISAIDGLLLTVSFLRPKHSIISNSPSRGKLFMSFIFTLINFLQSKLDQKQLTNSMIK